MTLQSYDVFVATGLQRANYQSVLQKTVRIIYKDEIVYYTYNKILSEKETERRMTNNQAQI